MPLNTKEKRFQVTWKATSWNGFHPTKPRFCSSSDFTPFCKNTKEVILPDKTRLFPKEPYVDDRAVAFMMNTARRSLKGGTQITAGPRQLVHRCWWGTTGQDGGLRTPRTPPSALHLQPAPMAQLFFIVHVKDFSCSFWLGKEPGKRLVRLGMISLQ